jgi:hypothetical protein
MSFVTSIVKKKTGCSKCRFSKRGCSGPRCHRIQQPIVEKGTVNNKKGSAAKKGNKKTKESGHSEQHGHLEQKVYEKKRKNPALRFIEDEASESSDDSQSSDDSSNSSNGDYDYNDGFLQEDGKIWKEVGGKWRIINDEEETERDDRNEMSNKEQLTLERNRALDELSRKHKKIKTLQRKHNEMKRKVQKLEKKVLTWKRRAIDQLLKNDKIQEQMLKQQQEKR